MASRALKATDSRWLADGIACDLILPEAFAPHDQASGLRADLASAKIDVVIQPAQGRRKRLLLADMDSTMIDQECIDELADEVG